MTPFRSRGHNKRCLDKSGIGVIPMQMIETFQIEPG